MVNIRSDNGKNFVGAERELRKALAELNHERIQGALISEGVEWRFNPPAGSPHGGAWERMMRTVKHVLNSVLHQQRLDDGGLQTVMCEVGSILTDRPSTNLSDDPNDLEPPPPFKGKTGFYHLDSSNLLTFTLSVVGDKFSTFQTCFGSDGFVNTCHCCKRDKSGTKENKV